jgi:hypothetical protein
MLPAFISPEEIYIDESADGAEQERWRQHETAMATVTEETILKIVTDALCHDPASELRDYIRQTLADQEALDYMPHSTGLRFAQEVARRVKIAIGGQVAMRLAVLEDRR